MAYAPSNDPLPAVGTPRPADLIAPDTLADASISMPPARRKWAGIVVLLIVDLALATAGAVLLARGLDDSSDPLPTPSVTPLPQPKPAVEPLPPPPPATKAAAAAPPAPTTDAVAELPEKPPEPVAKAPEPAKSQPPAGDAKQPAPAKTAARAAPKQNAEPVDLYAPDAAVAADVDRQAARSKTAFARCHHNAGVVDGTVRIAFSINPNGTVGKASAAENTTGSSELAACLANEVGSWVFSPHPGAAVDFVRAFTYR